MIQKIQEMSNNCCKVWPVVKFYKLKFNISCGRGGMADALDLGSSPARGVGSTPTDRTLYLRVSLPTKGAMWHITSLLVLIEKFRLIGFNLISTEPPTPLD